MQYIYYKLWRDFTGIVKEDIPALYSMMWLSVIHSVNLLSVLVIVNHFYRLKILYWSKSETTVYCSIILLFMIAINYFLLYKKREAIAEKYRNENKLMKILGIVILYVYMIGSFTLVYVLSQIYPLSGADF